MIDLPALGLTIYLSNVFVLKRLVQLKLISQLGIKKEIFSVEKDKSSRLDVFSKHFYQICLDIIKKT